ncbi:hypothetical protein BAUCODRAFT_78724 [Baudoinia panamericana UAMH 10762]|uniref:TRUD domain-containing protein n=1 Tax=Baudoinia panamericana (strain UAMH 10762) TaxID=717646 RepID=M2MZS4_BAUPA|nr:uncharacterized protein BAUCODRAFT_78724 [Baudoinia panamericana UAMH 10762]EMC92174.1 hypothetical protein BAUCODRAFT_78724 [Baudoinia panamericana UAMH 10762]
MTAKRHLDQGDEPDTKRVKTETLKDVQPPLGSTEPDAERAVGINVFVSPDSLRFGCVLKLRYTDFLVNEILPDGQVLHLTNLSPPKQHGRREKVAERGESASCSTQPPAVDPSVSGLVPVPARSENDEGSDLPDLSAEQKAELHGIFGPDVTNKILRLYASVLQHPNRKPRDHTSVRSELISEKAKRTAAHGAVRQIFASKLQTETLQDEPGVISIRAAPIRGPSGARGQQTDTVNGSITKGKLGWEELGGEYLHFTLYKENKDTMEALSFIAAQLKIPAKNFEFAGTKDRRAVTVQRVAVYRIKAERLAGLNAMARGWRVGDFTYEKQGLELGQLAGNEFVLTLKDCHLENEHGLDTAARSEQVKSIVSDAAEAFKTKGFLNYYGLQRFGTFSTGTHTVGMKMLQGDLEGAIDSILSYPPSLLPENTANDNDGKALKIPRDDIDRADTIRKWREGTINVQDIRNGMPKRFQAEAAIMQYLSKKDKKSGLPIQDNDWQGALMQIQRNLRLMYVHAYQSLVWNTVAGKRWEVYGNKVVEGDLVVIGEKDGEDRNGVSEEVDEEGEPIVRPTGEDSGSKESDFTRARPLNKADVESGRYDIFDVVLPLPGFDVEYPANESGKFYEDFMGSEEGGKLDPHKMRRAWKDVSLSGGYRKMMARPLKGVVEWEVKEYVQDEDQLVSTDLGRLQAQTSVNGAGALTSINGSAAPDMSDQPDGHSVEMNISKKLAVIMKFQLGSSQYATVALRELTMGGAAAYKPEFNTKR